MVEPESEASVLLIEDDAGQRLLVSTRLEAAGLAVETVATMYDAVEVLRLRPEGFDVVVIDLMLPDTSGEQSLSSVLEVSRLPVVIHSGSVDPTLGSGMLDIGATQFVSKDDPDPQALVHAVVGAAGLSQRSLPDLPPGLTELPAQPDLTTIVTVALELLMRHVPMGAWMLTRVRGAEWQIVKVVGAGYPIREGATFAWSDTLCHRMVAGEGPRVVPDIMEVPAFVEAPLTGMATIGRYVGIPIAIEGLGLYGTLCGIAPVPAEDDMPLARSLVPAVAAMLSSAIALDRESKRLRRRLGLADVATRTDVLTGLPNRRAFDLRFVVGRRGAWSAAVAVVDLNGLKAVNDREGHSAGDRLIIRAAQALREALGPAETAFRIGGDEFAVLAPQVGADQLDAFLGRLRVALQTAGVSAAIGGAVKTAGQTVLDALAVADSRMYAEKVEGTG